MTSESRSGPPGYIVSALDDVDVGGSKGPPRPWELEHVVKSHGWPGAAEDAQPREVQDRHDEQHKQHHAGDEVLAIPHAHWDFVEEVISRAAIAESVKELLLPVPGFADPHDIV